MCGEQVKTRVQFYGHQVKARVQFYGEQVKTRVQFYGEQVKTRVQLRRARQNKKPTQHTSITANGNAISDL